MRLATSPVCQLLGAAALALCSLSAQASFVSGVSVQLIVPGGFSGGSSTGFSATQNVALADMATGIFQGDNGAIGGDAGGNFGYMLSGETIFFDSATNSVRIHVAGGWDDAATHQITTGYLGSGGQHARYEISGLDIGTAITGFQAYDGTGYVQSDSPSGLLDPTNPAQYISLSGNTLVFDLDTLVFARPASGSGDAFAEFRINLTTDGNTNPGGGNNNLPEPATLALFAIAALGARAAQRRGADRG